MQTGIIEIVLEHIYQRDGIPAEKAGDFLKEASVFLREIMDALDEAIEEGQFENVVSNAHLLKGKLMDLGLEELGMIAGKIETAASSTSPLYLSCYYMRLRKELLPLLDLCR